MDGGVDCKRPGVGEDVVVRVRETSILDEVLEITVGSTTPRLRNTGHHLTFSCPTQKDLQCKHRPGLRSRDQYPVLGSLEWGPATPV